MLTVNEKTKAAAAAFRRAFIKRLIKDALYPDTIGTKKGNSILCRWGYFYSHGEIAENYARKIERLLIDNNIPYRRMNCGTHRVAFKGGASVANQSHFWVEVYVDQN